jgi:hypothetical protein
MEKFMYGAAPDGSPALPAPREPQPVASIASELERVATDIEYWYQVSSDELAVALHDALHAVHRSIIAVRDAQAGPKFSGTGEHWLG